jgi:Polyketide cyclase / dehydrase and lipid transport
VSKVSHSVLVDASLAEVWDYYFEPRAWPAWVDGFGRTEASDGYPDAGGSLRWRSIPAGRGEVTEHVLEHEPRRVHRAAFRDPESAGELRTTFEIAGQGTAVTQELEYRLRSRGPFTWLTDRLFIRSQVRGSVARSLARLKLEVEELAGGGSSAAEPSSL